MPPADEARFKRMSAAARAQLDEAAWQDAWAEGRTMLLEQVIAHVLNEQDGVFE
jgi:hypothetical protein